MEKLEYNFLQLLHLVDMESERKRKGGEKTGQSLYNGKKVMIMMMRRKWDRSDGEGRI